MTTRRNFIKKSAFSLITATTATACKRPIEQAIRHFVSPEAINPGQAVHYATTFYRQNHFCSLLAKVVDNRPIKIEGNSFCTVTQGGTSARVQASVLDLYNSNRLKHPTLLGKQHRWDYIISTIKKQLEWQKNNAIETLLLAHTIISPTAQAVIHKLQAYYPNLRVATYDEHSKEALLTANLKQFGQRTLPTYHFDKAALIISFNCDFLAGWISPIEHARDYTKRHSSNLKNRHIQLESYLTTTGAKADKRLVISPAEEVTLLRQLLKLVSGGTMANATCNRAIVMGRQLLANKGQSLVISGSNNLDIQLLVNEINFRLNNYNSTIDLNRKCHLFKGNDTKVKEELTRLKTQKTKGIILLDCDPVYELSSEIETMIQEASFSVALASVPNHSTKVCQIICPTHHYLESWGDAMPYDGAYALQQPVISALFDTRQTEEILLNLMEQQNYHSFLKNAWRKRLHKIDDTLFIKTWAKLLQDGVYNHQYPLIAPTTTFTPAPPTGSCVPEKVLLIVENPFIGTGEGSGNKWLHEVPHPISKIAWDNYAMVSQQTANHANLTLGDTVVVNGGKPLPVVIMPGTSDDVVVAFYGYGRALEEACRVGANLRNGAINWQSGAMRDGVYPLERLSKKNATHMLAISQKNSRISNYNPLKPELHKPGPNLYPEKKYPEHHWAMAIDLQACIGCTTCTVACVAENNIPVVGKSEVAQHREMHWLRVDRYFEGNGDKLRVHFQPVMCQHCDMAPCENVCPVAATNHSVEGINQMVYARCVGTRYCNNNCPYKTRTFNWFDYTGTSTFRSKSPHNTLKDDHLSRLVLNPDVTVRSKGVIEKCSFCVQRIVAAKNRAKRRGIPLNDGDIKTACQQACPTNAITFGDLNDEKSKVSELLESERSYHLLSHLGTKPSVFYLKQTEA